MADPDEIFLQPKCCADPEMGRLWCEDDAPDVCEDGVPWVRYVRADTHDRLRAEVNRFAEALVRYGRPDELDYACRECVPRGDFLIDGFSCAYHAAVKHCDTLAAEEEVK